MLKDVMRHVQSAPVTVSSTMAHIVKVNTVSATPSFSDSDASSTSESIQGPATPESLSSPYTSLIRECSYPTETKHDSKTSFKLGSSSIDEDRPFRVVVIGAGFSGILAGIRFPQRIKNLDLTIYEKNAGVGGTWWSNRYPGAACDYPAHCYQFSFEEKSDWSAFYSPGSEILANLERIVDKYKLKRYIKLQHELTHARYNEQTGKWNLKIRRPRPGSDEIDTIEDVADFVLLSVGSLSRWKWPDIEGISSFQGKLMHSAEWDVQVGALKDGIVDWKEKRVGVIGAGSTALQIVPAIQPHIGRLYNYVRGKVWLSPSFLSDKMLELLNRESTESNYVFTEEDHERLQDQQFFRHFRHELEAGLNSMHYLTIKASKMQQEAQKKFTEHMVSRLQKKPWIAQYLKPDFSVGCRRITPAPGYLEAVQESNVEVITTGIRRVTETGIELIDGTFHELDVLICATGFDTSFQYPFKVIGRKGMSLSERYTPYPETYLSICTDGFPNWFMTFGPNSSFGTGSFLPVIEAQVDYAIKAALKIQREHLKSIEPKPEAIADFDEYMQAYLQTTVFVENCRSWYKMGKAEGRNTGLWPGSSPHEVKALKEPRWEDFDYEYLDRSKNRFFWLGDGSTHNEKYMVGDRAWYLNEVDYPAVP